MTKDNLKKAKKRIMLCALCLSVTLLLSGCGLPLVDDIMQGLAPKKDVSSAGQNSHEDIPTESGEAESNSEKSTVKTSPTTDKNLVDTMTDSEREKIGKFFHPFTHRTPLDGIKTDMDIISFGVWQHQNGSEEFDIPQEKIEKSLERYLGVEEINHSAVGNIGATIPSYSNGYYNGGGGVGSGLTYWYNISKLFDNGNGTFTAKVNYYRCCNLYLGRKNLPSNYYQWLKENTDIETIGDWWNPDNLYMPEEEWNIPPGMKIIDGSDADSGDNIYRLSTDTVILKPYKYSGEDTWQIVSINGYVIPKRLLY